MLDPFLAIDPGTYRAGVALFDGRALVNWWLLEAPRRMPVDQRIGTIVDQLEAIVAEHGRDVQEVACERPTGIDTGRPAPELQVLVRRIHQPDRIRIAFDDHRLVANAGLILPSTLALRLGLPQLVDRHLDLGHATGRANTGDKMMTPVASALAGGDCIDDADALRAGGTARVLGFTAKAPSTLGAFLRSFRWGHVRQLDRVSRELLARAWAAGAGPGDGPLTIDLDSTICETYGLAKEGAHHHG